MILHCRDVTAEEKMFLELFCKINTELIFMRPVYASHVTNDRTEISTQLNTVITVLTHDQWQPKLEDHNTFS